ncbi:MAG TPA: hypothetical protein VMX76_02190 [Nevskiaceae bacterium]|nr:hypothetical protein [Nevskiaceae bacterium]
MEQTQVQAQPQPQFQTQKPLAKIPRWLLVLLGLAVLVLVAEGAYYFWIKRKPKVEVKKEPVFCAELDSLVSQFADAQREITDNKVIYTFEGKLLGVGLEDKFATYQVDLGKGILLGKSQSIKISLDVLPKKYFGREVSSKEDLNLESGELNSFAKMTLSYKKPCRLLEWEITAPALPPKPKEPTAKGEYLRIARQVLDWLDNQRDAREVYIFGNLCQISGQCETTGEDNRAGLAALWGRFRYYQVTQEKKDRGILTDDLDIYTNPAKIPVIQNDFWNCKLMYQMWQSDLLSDWQKEKVEKICWYGVYPPGEPKEVATPDLKIVIDDRPKLLKNPPRLSAFGGGIVEKAAFSADFSARYLWRKDEKELEKAIGFFNQAVSLYAQETSSDYLSGKWVLGIAALDLYRVTEETKYLDFAIALLEKEALEEICIIGDPSPTYCQESLSERATANLFLRQLFETTGKARYKNLASELTKKTIETAFDAQGYEGFFVGDGSFNSFGRGASIEKVNVYKPIRDNGLIVGILSENY